MPDKTIPVGDFMTSVPSTVGAFQRLKVVHAIMKGCQVCELPVKKRGELIGTLSDCNLRAALESPDCSELIAEDITTQETLQVELKTPLSEVIAAMAAQKLSSALIRDEAGNLVGIFTPTDAYRAFAQMLESACPYRREDRPCQT